MTNAFAPEYFAPLAPTTANRLQRICKAAAHQPTEVWRSACRTGVGPRREAGNPSGDSVVKLRFRCGTGHGETTRYSTLLTSAHADEFAAPGLPRRSSGCTQPSDSTGRESGPWCARLRLDWDAHPENHPRNPSAGTRQIDPDQLQDGSARATDSGHRRDVQQVEEVRAAQGVELICVDLCRHEIRIDDAFLMPDVEATMLKPDALPWRTLQKLE